MMEWTTPHYRFLARLLTRRTLLYTEMFVDNTLLFSPHAEAMLRFHPAEHPVACQLGGSNPASLARAALMAAAAGYDEINLNCGCPSAKVAGDGAFGARLMFTPELVRDCVAAMRAVVSIPVTVKCRLGADDMDSYEAFARFVRIVAESGCQHFIVHARKCLLHGLSPKDNRTIPPLRYDWVQRVAMEMPHLRISLNGGVPDVAAACRLLALRRGAAAVGGRGEEGQTVGGPEGALEACEGSGMESQPASSEEEGGCTEGAAALGGGCDSCCGAGEEAQGVDAGDTLPPTATPTPAVARDSTPEQPWLVYTDCHLPSAALLPAALGADDGVLASVMIGRAAYNNPWLLAQADSRVFGEPDPGRTRRQVVAAYLDYCDALLQEHGCAEAAGEEAGPAALTPARPLVGLLRTFEMAKPLLGLFHGCIGGGRFRTALTVAIQGGNKGEGKRQGIREAVEGALAALPDQVLDEPPGLQGEGGRG